MNETNQDNKQTSNVQKGRWGEDLAAAYLKERGYQIFFRNFYSKYGELDIVAKKNHHLIFVEVKTRAGDGYGSPAEAVDQRKRKHMTYAAAYFLQRFGLQRMETSFDVIEVSINHLENI